MSKALQNPAPQVMGQPVSFREAGEITGYMWSCAALVASCRQGYRRITGCAEKGDENDRGPGKTLQ